MLLCDATMLQCTGTNPSIWPLGLDEFVNEICSLRELSLYEERREILDDFFQSASDRISSEYNLAVEFESHSISKMPSISVSIAF